MQQIMQCAPKRCDPTNTTVFSPREFFYAPKNYTLQENEHNELNLLVIMAAFQGLFTARIVLVCNKNV
jgi:hypothetical protein